MSVAFDHRDRGTLEASWRDAAPWQDSAPLSLDDVASLMVLAAHPDDETLGAGGLLARAARLGLSTHVVIVTDGEQSYPGAGAGAGLGSIRRRESADALADVAPDAALTFLGHADGTVRENRDEVAAAIRALLNTLATRGRVLVAATWEGDGHRDHRVLGEIARGLAEARVEVVGYPVWMWHWAEPAAIDTALWRTLALDPDEAARKRRGIARHVSQLEAPRDGRDASPILHAGMRAHFERDVEVFITAPSRARDSAPTAYFDDLFRRHEDPWGFRTRWYEERKRDLLLAMLPARRYTAALEVGCATGVLTRRLADRADRVVGLDASDTAVQRARDTCADAPHVDARRARVPEEWADGSFDLIVLSEIVYYLGDDDREELARRVRESWLPTESSSHATGGM